MDDINSEKLFFKIIRNKIIFKIILSFLKLNKKLCNKELNYKIFLNPELYNNNYYFKRIKKENEIKSGSIHCNDREEFEIRSTFFKFNQFSSINNIEQMFELNKIELLKSKIKSIIYNQDSSNGGGDDDGSISTLSTDLIFNKKSISNIFQKIDGNLIENQIFYIKLLSNNPYLAIDYDLLSMSCKFNNLFLLKLLIRNKIVDISAIQPNYPIILSIYNIRDNITLSIDSLLKKSLKYGRVEIIEYLLSMNLSKTTILSTSLLPFKLSIECKIKENRNEIVKLLFNKLNYLQDFINNKQINLTSLIVNEKPFISILNLFDLQIKILEIILNKFHTLIINNNNDDDPKNKVSSNFIMSEITKIIEHNLILNFTQQSSCELVRKLILIFTKLTPKNNSKTKHLLEKEIEIFKNNSSNNQIKYIKWVLYHTLPLLCDSYWNFLNLNFRNLIYSFSIKFENQQHQEKTLKKYFKSSLITINDLFKPISMLDFNYLKIMISNFKQFNSKDYIISNGIILFDLIKSSSSSFTHDNIDKLLEFIKLIILKISSNKLKNNNDDDDEILFLTLNSLIHQLIKIKDIKNLLIIKINLQLNKLQNHIKININNSNYLIKNQLLELIEQQQDNNNNNNNLIINKDFKFLLNDKSGKVLGQLLKRRIVTEIAKSDEIEFAISRQLYIPIIKLIKYNKFLPINNNNNNNLQEKQERINYLRNIRDEFLGKSNFVSFTFLKCSINYFENELEKLGEKRITVIQNYVYYILRSIDAGDFYETFKYFQYLDLIFKNDLVGVIESICIKIGEIGNTELLSDLLDNLDAIYYCNDSGSNEDEKNKNCKLHTYFLFQILSKSIFSQQLPSIKLIHSRYKTNFNLFPCINSKNQSNLIYQSNLESFAILSLTLRSFKIFEYLVFKISIKFDKNKFNPLKKDKSLQIYLDSLSKINKL
ncbi:hypothetical protein DDB_G0283897 [Dictyostelium discoideum AX4]|uniref:Uncharacterized protein n=1 Tax=Dictyostelium discoideum TaxID=44689 RepID=Q54QF5_DICDI|nr:hypothetical protein DDB_G0283897 [Dictyostelium discoideum AX4]EAL65563.1 hypothetical protein DDB_G0283897 [Dictyostelium discoideum AX4]|eukprot:XP_638916.1 hypothetical protein DDB_G0283897 [Dictyostelium discoideum AX4]